MFYFKKVKEAALAKKKAASLAVVLKARLAAHEAALKTKV
jgi:hypothetical protein